MEKKIDYKKEYKKYYNPPSGKPEIVTVPRFKYLMTDGVGFDFENECFQNAIQALFGVSFKTKFMMKKGMQVDYVVMPLEGLWWSDNMDDFIHGDKSKWQWTLMIMQPNFVTTDIIQSAIKEVKADKELKALDSLRFESYEEGLASQIMHIGPFSEEHPNIMKIHELIVENGGNFDGKKQKHHEIYLSDIRKTAPEKLKTVLRQPFSDKV